MIRSVLRGENIIFSILLLGLIAWTIHGIVVSYRKVGTEVRVYDDYVEGIGSVKSGGSQEFNLTYLQISDVAKSKENKSVTINTKGGSYTWDFFDEEGNSWYDKVFGANIKAIAGTRKAVYGDMGVLGGAVTGGLIGGKLTALVKLYRH
jgi:hypothetical protein